MKKLTLTKKELAQVAGFTYRRLHDIDMSLPNDRKLFVLEDDGKYNLAVFVQRWVDYNICKDSEDDMSLEAAKAIHEQVKIEKTRTELAKMQGELVDITEVQKAWGDIAATVRQNMMVLPQKIAPQVYMVNNMDLVAGIIEKEITDVLVVIADTPKQQYEVQEGTEEIAEEEE